MGASARRTAGRAGGDTAGVCGRYALSSTDADLRRELFVATVVGEPLAASLNLGPSQPIRAVVTRPPCPADTSLTVGGAELEPAERQLRTVHWDRFRRGRRTGRSGTAW